RRRCRQSRPMTSGLPAGAPHALGSTASSHAQVPPMTRLKPLALALSVSLALAACQKADEPAATAAVPEAPKLQIDLAQVQQQPISLKAEDLDTSIQAC